MKIDQTDVNILHALQRDAHAKATDLATAFNLSVSPLYRRIRLLEEAGIIARYVCLLEQDKVGLPINAYVSVKMEKSAPRLAEFERAILGCEEVMECYLMTGAFDYMVRVVASDIAGIERFVTTRLATIEGVRDVSTSITMRRVQYKTILPVRAAG
ncbi:MULTISPECIES: Lrp/AsnC family transcriptional regulator [unclassified Burkholderia]|uniref:Lrp/AsnC family transcriptional regulator n=1 Tax=unclassified Burkholderia TaxID=2613784 RepID=UPI000469F94F|nr:MULTISPECIES: Lrp/AsnC family transcriptional regulator [unclassified Burkholderia]NIE83335.1 Lrp/AsnC family transcriptional regulator [Burkholderia sp. Tr-860]NIF62251.1 Lrp/AsnC family transcriptional regulator [Burkholderia sp. Cy-647]NIF70298.1 Lrp/AsnC family transcriptional regulator [Burkholderia sp. Ap-962]NIF87280.1 Lrp/AsnC family transcriptional regulator [Burkholderia sp. Cy-637]NIF94477.1 Lrp/AsnC family transcriptional regulator [Burkholderia sp. Ax-1720]